MSRWLPWKYAEKWKIRISVTQLSQINIIEYNLLSRTDSWCGKGTTGGILTFQGPISSQKSLPPLAVGGPLAQPNHPSSLARTFCIIALVNIIPKFSKEKQRFLLDLSSKFSRFYVLIWMVIKRNKVFFENFVNQNSGVCEDLPPNLLTGAEIFCLESVQGLFRGVFTS